MIPGRVLVVVLGVIVHAGMVSAAEQIVYFNDFEGLVGNEWSRTDVDVTPLGNRAFLGQFGNDMVALTLTNLPSHVQVTVSFDLFIINTWDGSATNDPRDGSPVGPDIWEVTVMGSYSLLRTTFSNMDVAPFLYAQAYPDEYPDASHPARTDAAEQNTLGYNTLEVYGYPGTDSVYTIHRSLEHAGSTLTLQFRGIGLQSLADESWGLDNVKVELFGIEYQTLTIMPSEGGSVLTPGEGVFSIFADANQTLEAVPADANTVFSHWMGTAVDAGRVADPNAAQTTVRMDDDYTLEAVFVASPDGPVLGYSLAEIGMENEQQFMARIQTNNQPDAILVERIAIPDAESKTVMQMKTVSSQAAQAKAHFGGLHNQRVLILFDYRFLSPDTELVVYLSNNHDLGDRDLMHTREVARILPHTIQNLRDYEWISQWKRYEFWTDTEGLELSQGAWVELELRPLPGGSTRSLWLPGRSVFLADASDTRGIQIDDWGLEVHCDDTHCNDVTKDQYTDWADFWVAKAAYGRKTGLPSESTVSRCFEGAFCVDGYTDVYDHFSLDWIVENESRLGNLCGSFPPVSGWKTVTANRLSLVPMAVMDLTVSPLPSGLWLLGKGYAIGSYDDFIDHLYHLSSNQAYTLPYDYSNMRLIQGTDNHLYILNSRDGLVDTNGVSQIPEDSLAYGDATVHLGIQWERGEPVGMPILDACVTTNAIYITPVVVEPAAGVPYGASARLSRDGRQVDQLYYDASWFNPNCQSDPYPYNLREIELDEAGNLYVLSVHTLNSGTMLWKYNRTGGFLLKTSGRTLGIEDPLALHYCRSDRVLYVGSGLLTSFDAGQTRIYQLSEDTYQFVLTLTAAVSMHHVTSMTSDSEGALWVAGFSYNGAIPKQIKKDTALEYHPRLAKISPSREVVDDIDLSNGGAGDIGLPTSLAWIDK